MAQALSTQKQSHFPLANPKGRKRKTVKLERRRTGLTAAVLDRHEIVALVGFSYPTIWKMMKAGKFPRGRVIANRTVWLQSEIDAWLTALPLSPIRVDPPSQQTIEQSATTR